MTNMHTIPSTLDHDDPRAVFARSVATGGEVLRHLSADQLGLPTPCPDFDVRRLAGHLVAVLQRVAILGRGGDAFEAPEVVDGVPDDGWFDAWTEAAHATQAVWSDDDLLRARFELPWASLTGDELLAMYTSEITVHTWDLASATGQHPAWDEGVVKVAFDSIRPMLPAEGRVESFAEAAANMPEGMGDFAPPFAAAVLVPDDAPLIDRLVGWTGRQP